MNEWLDAFVNIVKDAAKETGLWEVPGAFDGDGWVWAWRRLDEDKRRVAEAILRVRPDAASAGIPGILIQISAGAWMVEKRQISDGRVYYSRYIESESWPTESAGLKSQLAANLSRAWQGALSTVGRLPQIERETDEIINELREEGLPE